MLRLIERAVPPGLHRVVLRIAHRLRLAWWRRFPAQRLGVRVLALDGARRVLLVRHSYGSGNWMPPGGGLHRGENPVLAGVRECREETGCLLDAPSLLSLASEDLHGAVHRVHIVIGTTGDTPEPDGREIVAARFFALDALPADLAGGLRENLPRWLATATY